MMWVSAKPFSLHTPMLSRCSPSLNRCQNLAAQQPRARGGALGLRAARPMFTCRIRRRQRRLPCLRWVLRCAFRWRFLMFLVRTFAMSDLLARVLPGMPDFGLFASPSDVYITGIRSNWKTPDGSNQPPPSKTPMRETINNQLTNLLSFSPDRPSIGHLQQTGDGHLSPSLAIPVPQAGF